LRRSSSTLASSSADDEVPEGCYAELIKYAVHLVRRSKRHFINRLRRTPTLSCVFRCTRLCRSPEVKDARSRSRVQRDRRRQHNRKDSIIVTSDGGAYVLELPYIVRRSSTDSGTVPRPSPELSDVDPTASPRLPTSPPTARDNSSLAIDYIQTVLQSSVNAGNSVTPAVVDYHRSMVVPSTTNCPKTSDGHVILQDGYDAAGILRAKKGYLIVDRIIKLCKLNYQ